MAHKVHPKAFRIKGIDTWDTRGFYGKKLAKNLKEDFEIRELLKKKLATSGLEKIEIERFSGKTTIIINSSRPGLIIGRGGSGIEELKKELEKVLKVKNIVPITKELKIEIREIKDHWSSASLVAQAIAQQIEKRIGFRRVLKQAL